MTMTDPLKELAAYRSAVKRLNKWRDGYVARIETRRRVKHGDLLEALSPEAKRLLAALEDSGPSGPDTRATPAGTVAGDPGEPETTDSAAPAPEHNQKGVISTLEAAAPGLEDAGAREPEIFGLDELPARHSIATIAIDGVNPPKWLNEPPKGTAPLVVEHDPKQARRR